MLYGFPPENRAHMSRSSTHAPHGVARLPIIRNYPAHVFAGFAGLFSVADRFVLHSFAIFSGIHDVVSGTAGSLCEGNSPEEDKLSLVARSPKGDLAMLKRARIEVWSESLFVMQLVSCEALSNW